MFFSVISPCIETTDFLVDDALHNRNYQASHPSYNVRTQKLQKERRVSSRSVFLAIAKATSWHNFTSDSRHTCPAVIRLIRREIGLRKRGGGSQRRGYDNFFVRTPRGLIKARQAGCERLVTYEQPIFLPLTLSLSLSLSFSFYTLLLLPRCLL